MLIEEFIARLPKAELNIHLEGSLEPELMFELAKRNKIILDIATIDDAYHFSDLNSFLKMYYRNLQVLVTEQDFYDLTFAYLQKAAHQHVRHAEFFFDPQAHLTRGISFATIINGIHNAILAAEQQYKISAYPIMCFMRNLNEEDAQNVFEQALQYKDWIVAIGLDSYEDNPPEKFAEVFARARENGFLTVAIVGEMGQPEHIWQAIDVLKVSRIDHGVQCMQDPDLLAKLAATQIPLNVCPISNIEFGVFSSMREHPIKKMYENGLCVTINSDDPAYLHAYVNENYMAVNSTFKLSKAVLYEFAKNSFNASFLDHSCKDNFLKELDKFYKEAIRIVQV